MPTPRLEFAAVLGQDGLIYTFGGGNPNPLSTAEVYNPATDTWTELASMPTARSGLGGAVGTDGLIYTIGGNSTPSNVVSTVEAYNPVTKGWTTAASMPTPRSALGVVAGSDGKIYAAGGVNTTTRHLNVVEAFTLSTHGAFIAVPPCRVADTRNPSGPLGGPALTGGTVRNFPVPSSDCGIPQGAAAYSLNVAVVPHGHLDYLTLWPSGGAQPYVSTLNSDNGRIVANATTVPAGASGAVSVFVSDTTDVVLDINGYYTGQGGSGSSNQELASDSIGDFSSSQPLFYVPINPCRAVDTRNPGGTFGGPSLGARSTRTFPLASGNCSIPAGVGAYALSITVVPNDDSTGNYLTVWPNEQSKPYVSTLNWSGEIVANLAIVPAGASGSVDVFVTGKTDLIVDISGYYTSSPTTRLAFIPVAPCRIVDTRDPSGPFGGPALGAYQTRSFDIPTGSCSIPSTAAAYSLNATVVPQGELQFLTLWPSGQQRPNSSTLNSFDGQIVANAALTSAGTGGAVSVFVTDETQVILDINGYFAPQ